MTARRFISPRLGGVLFMAAGLMWCAAAWMGDETAFYGIGAMFILLGVSYWLRTGKGARS